MLTAASEHYQQQQRVSALALREARRNQSRSLVGLAQIIGAYQVAAITLTLGSTPSELAEQGIDAPSEGTVNRGALLTPGQAIVDRFTVAQSEAAFDALVLSLVQDAGRTAATVDIARRPAITGYVRSLNTPSCSRCAVLAGRVYRYSTGFQRHPRCDCLMTPTTLAAGKDLVLDPTDAIRDGRITGLSSGDREALDNGADLGQVVNVRRKEAGLTVGSSVVARAGRLTPQGVMRTASSREQSIDLLRRFGYLG